MQILRLLLILTCFVSVALGQAETGTISGLVTDESGALVPGVEVRLQSVERGAVQDVTTNNAGIYVFVGLKPGQYQIRVHKPGFKQVDFLGLIVNVQDHIEQNFRLQIGSVSESVTVEATGLNVNTTSGTVSTVIDREFVSQLPLNGRSFNTLLQLTPGAVIAPTGSTSPGQFSVNGERTNANYFQIDGVGANFGIGTYTAGFNYQGGAGGTQAFNILGGTSSLVSVDALQEFRVETSSFAPEYGHTPGGQAIFETRSGANSFHGDVFDYFRNTVLDANDWFNNQLGFGRTPEHQNDFGGVVGGPIVKDRTFFFLSYEGLRLLQPQNGKRPVPSALARSSATAAAVPYIDAFPQPNGPSTSNPEIALFNAVYDNRVSSDSTSVRVDEILSSKWSLFGRFNYAPSQLITRSRQAFSQVNTTQSNTMTATFGLTGTLAPSITNSLRANYSTQNGSQTARLDSFGSATPLDTNLLLPAPLSSRDSSATFSIFNIPASYEIGSIYSLKESQWNFVDAVSIQKGKHQWKFGLDYILLDFKNSGNPAQLSAAAFDITDFLASAQVPVFLYGVQRPATIRFQNLGVYAQDTWKASSRLTLTYGLRWEFSPTPSPVGSTQLVSWENTNTPSSITIAPPGTPAWNNVYHNFAPRVGLAYQLNSTGDFVLRGGFGMFYDLGTGQFTNLAATYPSAFSALAPATLTLPIANTSQYAPAPPSPQPPYTGSNFFAFANNITLPRSYQWNVALEKAFGGKQAVSLTYVGQVGRQLLRSVNVVTFDPNVFPNAGAFPLTLNGDTSDYHALQIQYRKQLSGGIQALLNYTWSHCIDTNSLDSFPISTGTTLPAQDDRGNCDFDVRHNFTGAITYTLPRVTKRIVLSQILNGWSLDGVAQARGGFPIDVTYYNFNFPVLGFVSARPDHVSEQPFYLYGAQCAQIYGPPSPTNPSGLGELGPGQSCPGGQGLNPNAFDFNTPQNAGRQGNLPRNAVLGFGVTQIDLSIARKFPITENINLQFRADAFNVLNHPNFSNPDPNLSNSGSTFGLTSQMLNGGLGGLTPLYQIGGPRSLQLSLKLFF